MTTIFDDRGDIRKTTTAARRPATDWLWRPWYAKLWWTTIPAWWIGMAASTRVPALGSFYDSALAGFLNILFFPPTALMVLGVCYVQQRLTLFPMSGESALLSDEATDAMAYLEAEDVRALEEFKASTDIYDPRSGGLFIGNPLSPQNPHHRF
ncbi:MAG: hypothetical protein ACOY4N_00010 [Pseudomonadota bacterium]|uniref:hypothetical protein n=1 Tax=Novosphingobium sp. CCH12-A3 TaxID=1768752 RepID=UPI000785EBE7|nr:hypothetical protein [Novosphingobium sp. CCH12-A3]